MIFIKRHLAIWVLVSLAGACQSDEWTVLAPGAEPVPANAIVVSRDESRAVVVGGKFNGLVQAPVPGYVFIINLKSGLMERELPSPGDGASSAVLMDHDNRVIAGSYDSSVVIGDLSGDLQTHRAWLANGAITAMAASPDGKIFAAAGVVGDDRGQNVYVMLCDRSAQVYRRFETGNSPVAHMAFSPDGGTLALLDGNNCDVALLDIHSGRLHVLRPGYDGRAFSIEFMNDGKLLIGGKSRDRRESTGRIEKWDIFSGKKEQSATCGGPVRSIAICEGADVVATASEEPRLIQFWSASSLTPLAAHVDITDDVAIVKLIGDGQRMLYATDSGVVGSAPVRGLVAPNHR